VTFDRPKGISVLQGLAPQAMAERMEQIHLEAVRESMAALESWVGYTMAGHHGDGQRAQRVDTSGLVGTMTVHRTARPVDDHTPGDPHLHTHVLVANLARGSDGKWRTIAAGGRDLMRHVPAVGELYRALERNKLTREFGVRFRQDARTGRWDVVGVPDDLKRTFSRRQAQVLAKAGDGATPEQGRAAARATARAKVASTPHSERASWHERARQAEHHPRQVVAAALEGREPGEPTTQRGGPEGPSPIDPDTVAAAVWDPQTGVTANTKTATRAKVMAHVAGVCGTGLPNAADLEELTDHVLDHALAQALPKSTSHFTHAHRYTSVDLVAADPRRTRHRHGPRGRRSREDHDHERRPHRLGGRRPSSRGRRGRGGGRLRAASRGRDHHPHRRRLAQEDFRGARPDRGERAGPGRVRHGGRPRPGRPGRRGREDQHQ